METTKEEMLGLASDIVRAAAEKQQSELVYMARELYEKILRDKQKEDNDTQLAEALNGRCEDYIEAIKDAIANADARDEFYKQAIELEKELAQAQYEATEYRNVAIDNAKTIKELHTTIEKLEKQLTYWRALGDRYPTIKELVTTNEGLEIQLKVAQEEIKQLNEKIKQLDKESTKNYNGLYEDYLKAVKSAITNADVRDELRKQVIELEKELTRAQYEATEYWGIATDNTETIKEFKATVKDLEEQLSIFKDKNATLYEDYCNEAKRAVANATARGILSDKVRRLEARIKELETQIRELELKLNLFNS